MHFAPDKDIIWRREALCFICDRHKIKRHQRKKFKYVRDKNVIKSAARAKRLSLVGFYSDSPEELDDHGFMCEYPYFDCYL